MLVFICREGGNVFCVKEEGYLLLGISTLLLLLWIVVKLALISRKTSMFNTADTHHLLFLVRLSFTWQFKKKCRFRKWFRSLLVERGGSFSDVFRSKHPDRCVIASCVLCLGSYPYSASICIF